MEAATSGPECAPRAYGTIIVVGGGCYGSFYVRQLGRARAAGALTWRRVLAVDRDSACPLARAMGAGDVATPDVDIVVSDWSAFLRTYLESACVDPDGTAADAIVPSPLMRHLMFEWLLERARHRFPGRAVGTRSLADVPGIPWQRSGQDGTRYVSFAEWVCPVNCIEPSVCPKTRSERWWTMPAAVQTYVDAARTAGHPMAGPVIFHCTHRAYGVGMFDTAAAVRADALVQASGNRGPADVLVGTVSHCHGALSVLTIGPANGGHAPGGS